MPLAIVAATPPPPTPSSLREEREEWAEIAHRIEAEAAVAERRRVVAFLRREAEMLTSSGLSGYAAECLAAAIEQGAHVEDA